MSLPTPPSTSHKEKENWAPRPLLGSRVSWSEGHQYRTLPARPSSTPPSVTIESSASRHAPSRSILKRTELVLPLMELDGQKEDTPEPEDPLTDLGYLENPVARILDANASLHDLAEAYSILSARLRSSLNTDSVVDSTWPIFQPLRQHRDAFLDTVVRDLGRVHINPLETFSPADEPCPAREAERIIAPPTPKDTPKKKRGMSGEQAKLARDLCTVTHAVIRFLNVTFTFPALYQLFSTQQLRFLLTNVLAIPMAQELPTINSRKTCALAVWLIQTMQLPTEVIEPAAPRIAYAIRRGIEGELGREGKKGAVNDGLKAIYELSTTYPEIFVPTFTDILPSLLSSLLAPTLVLRAQACHALGGFAYAAANIRPSAIHVRIAKIVATYLRPMEPLPPVPDANGNITPSAQKLPPSPKRDATIVRTLRTLLGNTEPRHVAQGPVWAWMVISYFIVLLGPTLYEDEAICRTITALFTLGLRHSKSSIRNLGFMAWRPMIWAYFHAPAIRTIADDEMEDADDEEHAFHAASQAVQLKSAWKVMVTVLDAGAGSAIIASLLSQPFANELTLRRALGVLRAMSKKGGHTCKEAIDAAMELLGVSDSYAADVPLEAPMLLPHGLFCAEPGLLTSDWSSLPSAARPILEQCLQSHCIRKLTNDELSTNWVFNILLLVFKNGLAALKLTWGVTCPNELVTLWSGLIKSRSQELSDENDEDGLTAWADTMTTILIDLIEDPKLDVVKNSHGDHDSGFVPTSPAKGPRTHLTPTIERMNFGLKLYLARELWHVHRSTFSGDALEKSSGKLLDDLIAHEDYLVDDPDETDGVRLQWASLCAEALFACDATLMEKFWSGRHPKGPQFSWIAEVRRLVWSAFVEQWRESSCATWEMGVIILSAPFMEFAAFDMLKPDIGLWNATLRDTMDKALDYGIDSVTVVDQIASTVSSHQSSASAASATHLADLLLSNLDINDARDVPGDVLQLVNDTLVTTYPPEPANKVTSIWLMRTLTRVLDACPVELSATVFELLQYGLAYWISDEQEVFTSDEYTMDIFPVYQTALLGMQAMPPSSEMLESVAPLLESGFCGRLDKTEAAVQAFQELWESSYVNMKDPSEGWSKRIQTCLRVILGEKSPVGYAYDLDDLPPSSDFSEYNDDLFAPEADDVDDDDETADERAVSEEILSVSPGFGSPIPSLIPLPLSPIAGPSTSTTPPSTPRLAPAPLFTTPTRPHRLHVRPEPSSPTSPLSFPDSPFATEPPRTPMTPKRSTQSQTTPRRTPLSSVRRRGDREKENAEPLPVIATVTERIAMASVLGKRSSGDVDDVEKMPKRQRLDLPRAPLLQGGLQFSGEDLSSHTSVAIHDAPSTPKRYATLPRTSCPASSLSPTADSDSGISLSSSPEIPVYSPKKSASSANKPVSVAFNVSPTLKRRTNAPKTPVPQRAADSEDDVFTSPPRASRSTLPASEPRARKRKGVFMEAVEVPTFKEVLRREQAQAQRKKAGLPRRTLSLAANVVDDEAGSPVTRSSSRIVQSARKATDVQPFDFKKDEPPESPTKKRKSRAAIITGEAGQAGSSSMSSTLRVLRNAPILGSDDSIMLVTPRKLAPKDLSSDDDPRFGKVNPVGVVSPAMRRLRSRGATLFDTPPSSDDSVLSNSPSREVIRRRIARLPKSLKNLPSVFPSLAYRKRTLAPVIDLTGDDD